ncbi:MAG: nitronate monooxygenase [Cryobacterium sp.]|nr:nitronate monooxygenase [Cryobacterium sp.]
MAGAAGGALAGAVCANGGFGMLGIGAEVSREWLAEQVPLAAVSGRPWGAGMMAWVLESGLDPVRMVLEHRPKLLCVSFGDPGPAVALAREAGVLSAMQIGAPDELARALEDDIDVIVCRGGEGGGHGRNEVATLPLLQFVLDRTDKPVIAAGGIGTARGVAAVLAAGAVAAWVGTRFAASTESLFADPLKRRMLAASLGDTVYTRAFDIAQRVPWPEQYGGRALRNEFTDRWADDVGGLRSALASDDDLTVRMLEARRAGDTTTAPVYAGQAVGLVSELESVADIMAELARFREHLAVARDRSAL